MPVRVAINGFGRVGRSVLRSAHERDSGIEIVAVNDSGRLRSRPEAARHLEAGARKVIISAPAKQPDATVVLGVNFDEVYDPERPASVQEINGAFRERAETGPPAGILAYTEDPIVSSDIVKSPYSAIFDSEPTAVVDRTQIKAIAWYDNEWGYSTRLVELAARVAVKVPQAV